MQPCGLLGTFQELGRKLNGRDFSGSAIADVVTAHRHPLVNKKCGRLLLHCGHSPDGIIRLSPRSTTSRPHPTKLSFATNFVPGHLFIGAPPCFMQPPLASLRRRSEKCSTRHLWQGIARASAASRVFAQRMVIASRSLIRGVAGASRAARFRLSILPPQPRISSDPKV